MIGSFDAVQQTNSNVQEVIKFIFIALANKRWVIERKIYFRWSVEHNKIILTF